MPKFSNFTVERLKFRKIYSTWKLKEHSNKFIKIAKHKEDFIKAL